MFKCCLNGFYPFTFCHNIPWSVLTLWTSYIWHSELKYAMTHYATDFDRISDFTWNENVKTTLKKQTSQKNEITQIRDKKAVHNYSAWKD